MAFGKTQGNIQSNVLSNFCIGKLILESDEIQVKIIGSGTIWLKFIYSEKATKFCKISSLLLSTVLTDKSKVEILQNVLLMKNW